MPRTLKAFTVAFGVALGTGLYDYAVPAHVNWHASQLALVAHIVSGVVALAALIPFVWLHQRREDNDWRLLFASWRARRRREGEPPARHRQRLIGYALHWVLLWLCLSGLAMALPALLWYAGVVWMPDYRVYRALRVVHLWLTPVGIGLLLLHFGSRLRQG
jgi:hypothetical protein